MHISHPWKTQDDSDYWSNFCLGRREQTAAVVLLHLEQQWQLTSKDSPRWTTLLAFISLFVCSNWAASVACLDQQNTANVILGQFWTWVFKRPISIDFGALGGPEKPCWRGHGERPYGKALKTHGEGEGTALPMSPTSLSDSRWPWFHMSSDTWDTPREASRRTTQLSSVNPLVTEDNMTKLLF